MVQTVYNFGSFSKRWEPNAVNGAGANSGSNSKKISEGGQIRERSVGILESSDVLTNTSLPVDGTKKGDSTENIYQRNAAGGFLLRNVNSPKSYTNFSQQDSRLQNSPALGASNTGLSVVSANTFTQPAPVPSTSRPENVNDRVILSQENINHSQQAESSTNLLPDIREQKSIYALYQAIQEGERVDSGSTNPLIKIQVTGEGLDAIRYLRDWKLPMPFENNVCKIDDRFTVINSDQNESIYLSGEKGVSAVTEYGALLDEVSRDRFFKNDEKVTVLIECLEEKNEDVIEQSTKIVSACTKGSLSELFKAFKKGIYKEPIQPAFPVQQNPTISTTGEVYSKEDSRGESVIPSNHSIMKKPSTFNAGVVPAEQKRSASNIQNDDTNTLQNREEPIPATRAFSAPSMALSSKDTQQQNMVFKNTSEQNRNIAGDSNSDNRALQTMQKPVKQMGNSGVAAKDTDNASQVNALLNTQVANDKSTGTDTTFTTSINGDQFQSFKNSIVGKRLLLQRAEVNNELYYPVNMELDSGNSIIFSEENGVCCLSSLFKKDESIDNAFRLSTNLDDIKNELKNSKSGILKFEKVKKDNFGMDRSDAKDRRNPSVVTHINKQKNDTVTPSVNNSITTHAPQYHTTTTTPVFTPAELQQYFQTNAQNFKDLRGKQGLIDCYTYFISDARTQSALSNLIRQKKLEKIVVTRNDTEKYELQRCMIRGNDNKLYQCFFKYDKDNKLQFCDLHCSNGNDRGRRIGEQEKQKILTSGKITSAFFAPVNPIKGMDTCVAVQSNEIQNASVSDVSGKLDDNWLGRFFNRKTLSRSLMKSSTQGEDLYIYTVQACDRRDISRAFVNAINSENLTQKSFEVNGKKYTFDRLNYYSTLWSNNKQECAPWKNDSGILSPDYWASKTIPNNAIITELFFRRDTSKK